MKLSIDDYLKDTAQLREMYNLPNQNDNSCLDDVKFILRYRKDLASIFQKYSQAFENYSIYVPEYKDELEDIVSDITDLALLLNGYMNKSNKDNIRSFSTLLQK